MVCDGAAPSAGSCLGSFPLDATVAAANDVQVRWGVTGTKRAGLNNAEGLAFVVGMLALSVHPYSIR